MDKQWCYRCMQPSMEGKRCSICKKEHAQYSANEQKNILAPGTELDNGSVVVGEKIGKGGFGITYFAFDRQTQRRIVLKEFFPKAMVERAADGKKISVKAGSNQETYDKSLRGFKRESKTINELQAHPHIVNVLFDIEDENETAYYGMEMLEGEDLLHWLQKQPASRVPAKEVCHLLNPIMDALVFCHKKGVLHRDISPSNIFMVKDENAPKGISPKLIDFGAAYVAIKDFTHSFQQVRNSGYSPLEQSLAQSAGEHSDVYSFCVTIYHMITGVVPTDSRYTAETPIAPPSQLGAKINAEAELVLMHGLARLPKDRIQSMEELQTQLCQALDVPVFHVQPQKKEVHVQPPKQEEQVHPQKQEIFPASQIAQTSQLQTITKRIFGYAVETLLIYGLSLLVFME